jgi:hypothetical protein
VAGEAGRTRERTIRVETNRIRIPGDSFPPGSSVHARRCAPPRRTESRYLGQLRFSALNLFARNNGAALAREMI